MKNLLYALLILLLNPLTTFGQNGYWSDFSSGSFNLIDLSDASKTPNGTAIVGLSAGDFWAKQYSLCYQLDYSWIL